VIVMVAALTSVVIAFIIIRGSASPGSDLNGDDFQVGFRTQPGRRSITDQKARAISDFLKRQPDVVFTRLSVAVRCFVAVQQRQITCSFAKRSAIRP